MEPSPPRREQTCRLAALLLFIDLNNGVWDPDPPDIDQAEEAMLAIAAGDVGEAWTAQWLRERVRFEGDD